LDKSRQEFRLSGLKKGFYLINVRGNNYLYSGKILSTGQSDGTLSIEMVSNNIEVINKKSSEAERKGDKGSIVGMGVAVGDRLSYTGYSGHYGTVTTDTPAKDSTVTFEFIPCSDGDHYYLTVRIGTQVWMGNDLQTIKLSDGTPMSTGPNVPSATPAFIGSSGSALEYGYLYNWYAVNTGKLCPTGWRVPSTYVDWGKLATYVGGDNLTKGGKLKETGTGHWLDPNYLATNEVGFTALPNGLYDYHYAGIGLMGYWWSSDAVPGGSYAEYVALSNTSGGFMNLGNQPRENYFSVRRVKEN
jgi:uncharacterized protein (TIGR02145 family)